MAFLSELPTMGAVGERAEKAMLAPIGATCPLWFAFGAAASAGVAYWWLSQLTKAVNVEAFAGLVTPRPFKPARPVLTVVQAPPPAAVTAEPEIIEPEIIELEPVEAAVAETASAPEPEEISEEPAPEPAHADDLTRMSGIGPKLSQALAAQGVTRFAQIAAWTAYDLSEMDKALSLKGRAVREAWVAQAKRLANAAE